MNGRSVTAHKARLAQWLRLGLRSQWIETDARQRADKQAAEDRESENNIIMMFLLFSAAFHNTQHHAKCCPV